VSARAEEVKYLSHHAFGLIAGSVLEAIAAVALTLVLLFLLSATRFRRAETPRAAGPLVIAGGVGLAVFGIASQVVRAIRTHQFATGHNFSEAAVEHALTKGAANLAIGYLGHNAALLAVPIVLAGLVLALTPGWWASLRRQPLSLLTRSWSRGPNSAVNLSQAINVWIVQLVVAIGPPLGAVAFIVYLKTDWGISLFFLVPLALVAIPSLRIPKIALFYLAALWLAITLAVLALVRLHHGIVSEAQKAMR